MLSLLLNVIWVLRKLKCLICCDKCECGTIKFQGKARGSKVGLWVRGESQRRLGHVGKWAGRRGGLVIFVGIVALSLLCAGIQNIRLDTTLASLWTPG